jgi:hypothetical protein
MHRKLNGGAFRALLLAVMLLLVMPGGDMALAAQGNPNPNVLPPNSRPHGQTYGEWSAAWWKWALEKTVAQSPLLDTTGANCAIGQPGHVWFLAGTFGMSTPVTRNCVVPPGTMLFIPVANAFCSAEGSFQEMLACAKRMMDTASALQAEIDGTPVQFLELYRTQSPNFTLRLPDGNILEAPAGDYAPSASDGVFLMVTPLQPGSHVIHFHAEFPGPQTIDVTYVLTIGH